MSNILTVGRELHNRYMATKFSNIKPENLKDVKIIVPYQREIIGYTKSKLTQRDWETFADAFVTSFGNKKSIQGVYSRTYCGENPTVEKFRVRVNHDWMDWGDAPTVESGHLEGNNLNFVISGKNFPLGHFEENFKDTRLADNYAQDRLANELIAYMPEGTKSGKIEMKDIDEYKTLVKLEYDQEKNHYSLSLSNKKDSPLFELLGKEYHHSGEIEAKSIPQKIVEQVSNVTEKVADTVDKSVNRWYGFVNRIQELFFGRS